MFGSEDEDIRHRMPMHGPTDIRWPMRGPTGIRWPGKHVRFDGSVCETVKASRPIKFMKELEIENYY